MAENSLTQSLHEIWNLVMTDPKVAPHEVVIEGMRRAYSLGYDVGGAAERIALEEIASGLSVRLPYDIANEALGCTTKE